MTTVPSLREADFSRQVTDLAEMLGWQWAHFRPAETARGWRTPVSGSLGKGWPDLVLIHQKTGRLIFAELKRDGAKTTVDQDRVLEVLRSSAPVFVWRPSDFDQIQEALR